MEITSNFMPTSDDTRPATNIGIIFVIVITLATNATIGVSTLCYCLVMKVEPNTALLTALIGIVNFVLGAIGGMLVKTSPTEATKQQPSADVPVPVAVVNKRSEPVPTEEAKT